MNQGQPHPFLFLKSETIFFAMNEIISFKKGQFLMIGVSLVN